MRIRPIFGGVLGFLVSLPQASCREEAVPEAVLSASDQNLVSREESLTFNQDIAPIIFEQCSPCHRPRGTAPFPLLSYFDVKRRAQQIAQVTESRYMPPWLPEPSEHQFIGERRLHQSEIQSIKRWIQQGAIEGDRDALPQTPSWPSGWQLGTPDLVVQMPESYLKIASPRDTWRNFIIPLGVTRTRYVKAVDLKPGNPKIVHHAVMEIDRFHKSSQFDAEDAQPGFDGMRNGTLGLGPFAENPDGQYLGWTPGKVPYPGDEGIAWRLDPGTDLILQLHMPATGKDEVVQSSIALYFSNDPPTRFPFSFLLASRDIDIPPGVQDYTIQEEYVLPVDVEVLGVFPHAHYLCREMLGYALLPEGEQKILIHIKEWDFNWQDEYRYVDPVYLPKGTRIGMRYRYDNSVNNARNPSNPPKRVLYGEQSTDEMGELAVQVLPSNKNELEKDFLRYQILAGLKRQKKALAEEPTDFRGHNAMGDGLLFLGRSEEAEFHFREVARLQPQSSIAHAKLANMLEKRGQLKEATEHYSIAARLDPENVEIHLNLAILLQVQGQLKEALDHYRKVLRLQPETVVAQVNLGILLGSQGHVENSIKYFRLALRIDPDYAPAHMNLGVSLRTLGKLDQAVHHLRRALEIDPDLAAAQTNLQKTLEMLDQLGKP